MGSFWTPPFSKVFLNFPTPLGLSLLLPQLSDQPNVNKKTCRANFQSSEKLTVITAPGKNENNSIFYYFFNFQGDISSGSPPSFHISTHFPCKPCSDV